jgi:hypothetical protein
MVIIVVVAKSTREIIYIMVEIRCTLKYNLIIEKKIIKFYENFKKVKRIDELKRHQKLLNWKGWYLYGGLRIWG